MEPEQLIALLIVGAVAGFLAGKLIKGGGFGLLGNIVVGLLGAAIGQWLFRTLDISVGGKWVGPIVTATAGAVVLLFGVRLIKKA
ncbi:MAG: GlsB/YeaQ/YmgE family stress response membrane protein [Planctomycetes bacterium]|nr:GlsB/YeaQ/YmgE family stress response membrane protein [Planctomycetota bacterium]